MYEIYLGHSVWFEIPSLIIYSNVFILKLFYRSSEVVGPLDHKLVSPPLRRERNGSFLYSKFDVNDRPTGDPDIRTGVTYNRVRYVLITETSCLT